MVGNPDKTKSIDETVFERLWRDEIAQISPEVRTIIVLALKKARERQEMNKKSLSWSCILFFSLFYLEVDSD